MLPVVYDGIGAARLLPYTDSPGGSPLSYSERRGNSADARKALERATFTVVPALCDAELRRVFTRFVALLDFAASPAVDYEYIRPARDQVVVYGDFVRDCLAAHIAGEPLPAEPVLNWPDMRSGRRPPA